MKILAIDTATEACSAALLVGGHVTERYEVLGRGHAEHVLPMVDSLLAEAGVALATLDAIAFGRGPGAFTGVRIAVSVVQGLAFGAGLPVVPVSDLAALAARAAVQHDARRVLACMDARMQQVYWAVFDVSEPARPVALTTEQVTDPAYVALPDATPCFGAGHGFAAYPGLKDGVPLREGVRPLSVPGTDGRSTDHRGTERGLTPSPRGTERGLTPSPLTPVYGVDAQLLPRAREMVLIGAAEYAAGRALRPEDAAPVYIRDQVAHVRR